MKTLAIATLLLALAPGIASSADPTVGASGRVIGVTRYAGAYDNVANNNFSVWVLEDNATVRRYATEGNQCGNPNMGHFSDGDRQMLADAMINKHVRITPYYELGLGSTRCLSLFDLVQMPQFLDDVNGYTPP